MIEILLFLGQYSKKCSLCSKSSLKGISGPANPVLVVVDREEESKLTLRHAAEFETDT